MAVARWSARVLLDHLRETSARRPARGRTTAATEKRTRRHRQPPTPGDHPHAIQALDSTIHAGAARAVIDQSDVCPAHPHGADKVCPPPAELWRTAERSIDRSCREADVVAATTERAAPSAAVTSERHLLCAADHLVAAREPSQLCCPLIHGVNEVRGRHDSLDWMSGAEPDLLR